MSASVCLHVCAGVGATVYTCAFVNLLKFLNRDAGSDPGVLKMLF